ncbi:MAG: ATP-binding cassette domain-containing protein [Bdellovibrionales bacterium]|nr:ATP-binding cassette domain-containing protein [Bdellovibrionales bacterium]
MKPLALELDDGYFSYKVEGHSVPALNGVTLSIADGEMVAIQGPSGSGKSTLLYLLGCMLRPDRGTIRVQGEDIRTLDDVQLAYFRNRQLGFVFQQFHLLPAADVLTNILLPTNYPLEVGVASGAADKERAIQLATQLGLGDRIHHKTQQLSGGQQQRVAIARALIRDAPVLLADEPTGNLDSNTSKEILKLLRQLNNEGKTIVIITHDAEVAAQCDRVIWIRDGKVQNPEDNPAPRPHATRAADVPDLPPLNISTLFRESLPRAWDNLKRNRVRSALTMLGVVVGVASIVAMLTLGTFTKEKILQSYASLGVNTLLLHARPNWMMKAVDRPPTSFNFLNMERDVLPLQEVFPEVVSLSPLYSSWGNSAVFGGRSIENEASVIGVNEHALGITRRPLAAGAPIGEFHVKNRSSVCVIGFEIAQRLFLRQNPIGEVLQVGVEDTSFSCTVIGVSKPVFSKETRFKPDLQIIVPYTAYVNLPFYYYHRQLGQVLFEIDSGSDIEEASKKIRAFFQKKYGKSGIFRADSDSVLVAQMKRFLNLFTLLLVSVAAISLVVGGMGITNMMLVSVNERFREIGLRKAMGASHSAIRQLFFAESLFLCGIAGLTGLLVGFAAYQLLIYAGTRVIPDLKFEWVFNPWAFVISFAAIVVTGVLSGLGPALRAEKLQVIEALRSE